MNPLAQFLVWLLVAYLVLLMFPRESGTVCGWALYGPGLIWRIGCQIVELAFGWLQLSLSVPFLALAKLSLVIAQCIGGRALAELDDDASTRIPAPRERA